ncbi:MAG: Ser-Thr-rich GPI-anchored membrane family protein [Cyclobacteriaceae bacterium]
MRLFYLFCLLAFSQLAFAQNVAIKEIELAGEKIIVHYDLDDANINNEYILDLYSNRDNFSAALLRVKGDIGTEVKPGKDKKVEWSVRDELGNYNGKIALELRGKVFTPIVKLQEFSVDKKYKRGKSYPIKWRPGNTNPINIELFKGTQRIAGEVNHPNSGSSSLSIPSDAERGDDYRLKITDTKNPSGIVYSQNFRVVPKIPMLIKVIVPLAVVGGAVFGLSGSGGESGGTAADTELPLPSFPTGN